MNKNNEYFVSFYGDLDGVRDDLSQISTTNPRCVEANELFLSCFSSHLELDELSAYLSKEKRLFSLVKIINNDSNVFLHFGELNKHLLNKNENYNLTEKVNLHKNEIIEISEIDEQTKNEIINDLLSKHKKSELSDVEKSILKKLANNE